jgi:hypothetical protein
MPASPRRSVWTALLVVCAAWIGAIGGAALGARYFVPRDAGLAAGASVLGYGLAGAIGTALLAGVLGMRMPARSVRTFALVALGLALASFGYLAYLYSEQQARQRAADGSGEPLPPPSELVLEARIDDSVDVRAYRELSLEGMNWRVEWIATGPTAETCSTQITAAEAAAVNAGVEALEAALAQGPPCAGEATPVTHRVRWRRGAGERELVVEGGEECLQRRGEWPALVYALNRIPIDAVSHGRARCR